MSADMSAVMLRIRSGVGVTRLTRSSSRPISAYSSGAISAATTSASTVAHANATSARRAAEARWRAMLSKKDSRSAAVKAGRPLSAGASSRGGAVEDGIARALPLSREASVPAIDTRRETSTTASTGADVSSASGRPISSVARYGVHHAVRSTEHVPAHGRHADARGDARVDRGARRRWADRETSSYCVCRLPLRRPAQRAVDERDPVRVRATAAGHCRMAQFR